MTLDHLPGSFDVLATLSGPEISARDVLVWTPPGEAPAGGYPVVYMHDAQNLFDEKTAFAGTWGVAETLAQLAEEGMPAIVVAIPHGGAQRIRELSPFADRRHGGGGGERYLDFLVEVVKPLVDERFPVRTDAASTTIAGSSLGGLISLWGWIHRSDAFGHCGALSPSCRFGVDRFGHAPLLRSMQKHDFPATGRLYLDVGTRELMGQQGRRSWLFFRSWLYRREVERVGRCYQRALRHRDLDPENMRCVVEPGALHHEAAWRRRLPDALRFLLGKDSAAPDPC